MKNHLNTIFVFFTALVVRVIYYFFGTSLYYGKTGYQVLGDTPAWQKCVENLVNIGTYSANTDHIEGVFFRPPGYGLFMLPYYLFFGDWSLAHPWMAWTQIILDCFTAVLFYKIVLQLTKSQVTAIVSGCMYALYFFALGWTPALYPESLAMFFVALSVYFFARITDQQKSSTAYSFFSAFALGIAILMRVQLILVLPAFILVLLVLWLRERKKTGKYLLLFLMGISLSYGLWPARNLIIHGDPVLLVKNGNYGWWADDLSGFLSFIWAVKVDHEPQWDQLLGDRDIDWPAEMTLSTEDSLILEENIVLMRECGIATQIWKRKRGYHFHELQGNDCNDVISRNWEGLVQHQKQNYLKYWVIIPLRNIHKAIFKSALKSKETGTAVKLLFWGRTALIIIGILTAFYLGFRKVDPMFYLIALIVLCWIAVYVGIAVFYRNMEIRYFMQVDSLLLLPIALLSGKWLQQIFARSFKSKGEVYSDEL